ncbi:MAG: low molecular weight protein-tyrosine-phosphatase [Solirubrobacteraceae bacterium]
MSRRGWPAEGGTPQRILFVCTGNICRSPTAEAVMRKIVGEAGLGSEFAIDSAGTGSWHEGEPAQELAVRVAAGHGYEIEGVARRVEPGDLGSYDVIVALDHSHLRALRDMTLDVESRLKVRLLVPDEDVPDPYGGSEAEFERTFALIERGCRELFAELTAAPF